RSDNRSVEENTGDGERGRRTQQRGNVRIDLRIKGDHGGNDLNVVEETIREQRTNRAIDETRGQRLLLGRSTFTLEESAGDTTRSVRLLNVVDRQREEVASRLRGFLSDGCDEDDGVA